MLLKDLTGEQVLAGPEFETEIAGVPAFLRDPLAATLPARSLPWMVGWPCNKDSVRVFHRVDNINGNGAWSSQLMFDDGVSGGIANVTYFSAPLGRRRIELNYDLLKNRKFPII